MSSRVANLFTGLLLLMLLIGLTGCREPVVEVDPEDLNLIDQYVDELTLTLLDAEPDLLGWVREPYSENMPLQYSEERIAFLSEHLNKIRQLRAQRHKDSFPDESLIVKWQVIVVRGSDEWLLEGPAVADALARLEALSDKVEQSISEIIASEGNLDAEQSKDLLALLEEMPLVIVQIRQVFHI